MPKELLPFPDMGMPAAQQGSAAQSSGGGAGVGLPEIANLGKMVYNAAQGNLPGGMLLDIFNGITGAAAPAATAPTGGAFAAAAEGAAFEAAGGAGAGFLPGLVPTLGAAAFALPVGAFASKYLMGGKKARKEGRRQQGREAVTSFNQGTLTPDANMYVPPTEASYSSNPGWYQQQAETLDYMLKNDQSQIHGVGFDASGRSRAEALRDIYKEIGGQYENQGGSAPGEAVWVKKGGGEGVVDSAAIRKKIDEAMSARMAPVEAAESEKAQEAQATVAAKFQMYEMPEWKPQTPLKSIDEAHAELTGGRL